MQSLLSSLSLSSSSYFGKNNNSNTILQDSNPHYDLIKGGKLLVVNAPACYGQPIAGVEDGPKAIMEDGRFIKAIEEIRINDNQFWSDVSLDDIEEDFKNHITPEEDEPFGLVKHPRSVGKVTEVLHHVTYKGASEGRFVLTLGGDHSIALGSIAGIQKNYKDLAVIWVDAHSDIHMLSTTDSGNLHGCPVSFLLGLNSTSGIHGFSWLKDLPNIIIKPERIVYIGLRDIDEPEKAILKKYKIAVFDMRAVTHYGISKVVELALKAIDPEGKLPLHLSFDIDALDPTIAPSTGTPVRGGLHEREGHFICHSLAMTGRLVSMDLVEVNPNLGTEKDQQSTIRAAQQTIYSALGKTYL